MSVHAQCPRTRAVTAELMADHRDEEFSESGDHGSVQDDGDAQQQRRLSHSRPASSQITLQDLEKYYDVPLTEGEEPPIHSACPAVLRFAGCVMAKEMACSPSRCSV